MLVPCSVLSGIVVYNTPIETLEMTVACLQNSSIPIQVVVLCNSTEAEYQTRVERLCINHGCTYLRSQENRGFGAAHNQIFNQYQSPWYLCCNPDTVFPPTTVQRLLDAYGELTNPALVMPLVVDPGNPLPPTSRPHLSFSSLLRRYLSPRRDEIVITPISTPKGLVFPIEFVSGCFFLVSRNIFQRLGGFDSKFFLYCEDADLSLRASHLGQNYLITEAILYHPSDRASFSSLRMFSVHLRSMIRYLIKHAFTAKHTRLSTNQSVGAPPK